MIAINPFKEIPHLYGNEVIKDYFEKPFQTSAHVYSIGNAFLLFLHKNSL